VVGATMIAHGVKHARSLEGTAGWFDSIGFRKPELQAKTSAVVEVAAGTALLAGIGTPLAASAVIGTMLVAARSVHVDNGFFITSEGYEYVLTIGSAAAAIAALAPDRYSVDSKIPFLSGRSGWRTGLTSIALGAAGATAQLATFWRRPVAG
jgi:putative oxidoreductase